MVRPRSSEDNKRDYVLLFSFVFRYYLLPEAVFPADEKVVQIGVACYTTNSARSSYSFLVGEVRVSKDRNFLSLW